MIDLLGVVFRYIKKSSQFENIFAAFIIKTLDDFIYFLSLKQSEISFAERKMSNESSLKIKNVTVFGGGQMGSGIAHVSWQFLIQ